MKDIQKIKEFFSKPLGEVKTDKYGNHIEPQFKKGDKVTYLGHPAEITAVNKEMGDTYSYSVEYDKGQGKTKASNLKNKGSEIKLAEVEEKYTVAGHSVTLNKGTKSDGTDWTVTFKNGKSKPLADVLALIKPMPKGITMNEAKKETGVDMAKKQLDALGVKYEMSKTDKVRPFKVIYKPVNKEDDWYDKFEDIVDLFNLKGFVKSSMEEAKFMSGLLSGKDFINAKLRNYPKAIAKVNQLIDMIGESRFTIEMAEWIWDFFNNASFEQPVNEAKSEDKVDTITMDIPLFLRMLEYSREDASQDMDLHDVTEKANKLGKEKGILSMDDYDEIVGAAEEIKEVNLKQSKLSSAEYQKAKKLKDFKASDWKWNADEDLYTKVNEGELTEAYVPSNIKEFAKRKGVSSLVNKVAGWAEKVGKGIRGGTAIGYNYSTLILDMTYQGSEIRINTDNDTVTLYDEPVYSFNDFKQVYLDNQDESDNSLEERIAEALDKINEELCPAGKAYIKRRKAAGEKSSAYLSGRAVKVCKGQMSGRAKKK